MLVLTRKPMQQVRIGDNITITVVKVDRNAIRLAIEAPRDVHILRGELKKFDETNELEVADTDRPLTVASSENEGESDRSPLGSEVRRSMALRRDIPRIRRDDRSVPRAPSHPLRWTVASMRQRIEASEEVTVDVTSRTHAGEAAQTGR